MRWSPRAAGAILAAMTSRPPSPEHPAVTRGVVTVWHDDDGWGVIEIDESPGGCWAHVSRIHMRDFRASLDVGEIVDVQIEPVGQDGYDHRAVSIRRPGEDAVLTEPHPAGDAYRSTLEIGVDADDRS